MDKIKITSHQFFSLTANASIGGAIIVISATAAGIAKQDAWISELVAIAFGVPFVWLYWFLGSRHPGMTLIGINREVFGKWIGLIPSTGFVLYCLTISNHVIFDIGKFITIQAMPETPPYVINALFTLVILIAISYGIETIARASELFIYFVSFLFLSAMVLDLPNARIENLQPALEKGIFPVLKGSLVIADISVFPLVILLMIYPSNFPDTAKAKTTLFKGYLWAGVIIFVSNITPLLVLGSKITASMQYPAFTVAKEINIGIIFTRLEFIVAATWIVTQFLVSVLYFYSGIYGLSELLGLNDHKRIILPMGFIISVMAEIILPDFIYQITWRALAWPPFVITFGVVIPVMLFIVFWIKKLAGHIMHIKSGE